MKSMFSNLLDCCTVVVTRCAVSYTLSHTTTGEHASLWWENKTVTPGWLLVSSDGESQQFFLPPEELPDVIKVLFQEGWTWK
jgi:hypothetical protein